jgi:hypothetical protein
MVDFNKFFDELEQQRLTNKGDINVSSIKRVKVKDVADVEIKAGQEERVKLEDVFDLLDLKKANGQFVSVRPLGGIVTLHSHWVRVESAKTNKVASYVSPCLKVDPDTGEYDDDRECPLCKAAAYFRSNGIKLTEEKYQPYPVSTDTAYIMNVISRDRQEEIEPKIVTKAERESGFKDITSKSRTPVQVLVIKPSLAKRIKEIAGLNKHVVSVKGHNEKRTFPLYHAEYGRDLMVKFDPDADGSDKYSVQRGDISPLTDEEKELLQWDIGTAPFLNDVPSVEAIEKDIARMGGEWWDDYRESEGMADDDDEDDIDDDLEDDEDEAPRSKSKSKSKSKPVSKSKRKVDKDEEEDEEDEDDLGIDDDEDEDIDDLDDEEEEDEAPRSKSKAKSKSKPVAKSKKKVEEDEDDLDDLDEEDEDDLDDLDEEDEEEKPRAKSKSKAKPVAKSKKKPVDEDDEDDDLDDLDDLDDDEDDEDEEEEEKPRAKSKAKSKAKPVAKSKESRR